MTVSDEPLNRLLTSLETYCRSLVAPAGAVRTGLDLVIGEIASLGGPESVPGRSFPQVDRRLPALTASPPVGARGELLGALARAAPLLRWGEARIYGDGTEGDGGLEAFYDGYAFCQLVGPSFADYHSPWPSPRIRLGVTLQAPGTFYPAHAHLAQELYVVIGGAGLWRQGEQAWTAHPPDRVIFHDHHEPHAMQTHDEALLSLFAWPGDVDSFPVLTDHDWSG